MTREENDAANLRTISLQVDISCEEAVQRAVRQVAALTWDAGFNACMTAVISALRSRGYDQAVDTVLELRRTV